jgi:hypothetical protein
VALESRWWTVLCGQKGCDANCVHCTVGDYGSAMCGVHCTVGGASGQLCIRAVTPCQAVASRSPGTVLCGALRCMAACCGVHCTHLLQRCYSMVQCVHCIYTALHCIAVGCSVLDTHLSQRWRSPSRP